MDYKTEGFNKNLFRDAINDASWLMHDLGRLAFDPFVTDKEIEQLKKHMQNIKNSLDGLTPTEENNVP